MTPEQRLSATFSALADPTRRAILARLTAGEASVLELAQPFAITLPAISKHLTVLERLNGGSGLVGAIPKALDPEQASAALGPYWGRT